MSNEHVWEWAYLTAMSITDYITQKIVVLIIFSSHTMIQRYKGWVSWTGRWRSILSLLILQ